MTQVLNEIELTGFDSFPDSLVVLEHQGKHLLHNVTPASQGGEFMPNINALACFESEQEAQSRAVRAFRHFRCVTVDFESARQIAISKPEVSALVLLQGGKAVELHWVR